MDTELARVEPSPWPTAPAVLLVDDHPVFRAGLVAVLSWPGCRWRVHEAASVAAAEALLSEHPLPDLILYDWHMPVLGGCRGLERIRDLAGGVPVVVITADDDDAIAVAARQCGAAEVLSKSATGAACGGAAGQCAAAEVLSKSATGAAIRNHLATLLGARVQRPDAADTLATTEPTPTAGGIGGVAQRMSQRQREVLGLLALGCSNKRIATRLAIAEATVRAHVSEIFKALQVHNRTQAALMAARLGLANADSAGRPLH